MTTPINAERRPEDAARRFAGELGRLADGLRERGIELRDSPVHGAEVDTVLGLVDQQRRDLNRWVDHHAAYDRIVSVMVRTLREEGFVT